MIDKERIREEIERKLDVMQYQVHRKDAYKELKGILTYIDSLQEEPVNKDLEETAKHYLYSNILYDDVYVGNLTDKDCIEMFNAGAKWHKEQMMAKAIDANCFGFQGAALFSFRLPADKYLIGSGVKVIVVKED